MVEIDPQVIQTDVLVVGGGIAGLMASIAAAQAGASGGARRKSQHAPQRCGATGNDHFLCYCPPVHGLTWSRFSRKSETARSADFTIPA